MPEVLSTVLKTKGTVFSRTDRPRPVNNLFITRDALKGHTVSKNGSISFFSSS